MSDAKYQKYIDNIDEALASININPKLVRQNIATLLVGEDAIHPSLYTIIPRTELQKIGTQLDNRFDFIIDILDNHITTEKTTDLVLTDFHKIAEQEAVGSLNTTRFVNKLIEVAEFADELFVEHKAYQLEEFNDLPVYLKQFVLHLSEFIGQVNDANRLPTQREIDVIPQLIAEYGIDEAELSKEFLNDIESVYTRTDGVDMSPGFFNKYYNKGADAANIFTLSVGDTLRIPIELTRNFVVESLNNRQTLQLHSALQDPDTGPYIENLLDNVQYEPTRNIDGNTKGKNYGSFSDTVDLISDNAWYGIKNTTNKYVSIFRNNIINFINGDVTGAYIPDDDAITFNNIDSAMEQALGDLTATIQDIATGQEFGDITTYDIKNLETALDNPIGKNLTDMLEPGSTLSARADLHTWLHNPGATMKRFADTGFTLSDNALKASGAVSPEFIEQTLEIRKLSPGLVPEIQQTVQEMTTMLKPTIDNAFSVFEIQPPANDIFHIRPLKDFLNYTNANNNVDVRFYNFNTSKFEDMGILGIVKSGVNNSPPDTLVIEVTPKKIDMIEDVIDFVDNLPEQAGTKPEIKKLIAETPADIAEYIDKSKLPEVENVLKDPKIGKAISETSLDFARKAGKFGFGGAMKALAPGDFIIETGIRKLLPKLGLASISIGALAAYTAYELALLAADATKGLADANKAAGVGQNEYGGFSFTGGKTLEGKDVDYKATDFSSYGKDFWKGFTEDNVSDKYSIGYKLTKEVHNALFEDVYGRMTQDLYAGTDS